MQYHPVAVVVVVAGDEPFDGETLEKSDDEGYKQG